MVSSLAEARMRARPRASGEVSVFIPPPLPRPDERKRRPRMSGKPEDRIHTSILRPHVLAQDRFLSWLTPYGVDRLNTLAQQFPAHLLARRRIIITSSIKPKSLGNYAAGLVRFTKFCDNLGIPEQDRMPASENLLSLFVATRGAGSVGEGAMKNWLQGLELWHTLNGAPWNGRAELKRVLKGSTNFTPDSSFRPKRDPVTIEHLRALRKHLDLSDTFDAAVWAIACIAFWCCCRLGELLLDSANDFDPRFHVSRSTTINRGTTVSGVKYAKFHIPSSKTKGRKGDDINITDSDCITSAIEALENHLIINAAVPGEAPLFAWESADGSYRPMTREWFMSRCNEIWQIEGLGSLLGHGFRIGGTTHLLLLGVDPTIVMALGRWTSKAFLAYWRQCEQILAMFIGFSLDSRSSVIQIMSNFRATLLS